MFPPYVPAGAPVLLFCVVVPDDPTVWAAAEDACVSEEPLLIDCPFGITAKLCACIDENENAGGVPGSELIDPLYLTVEFGPEVSGLLLKSTSVSMLIDSIIEQKSYGQLNCSGLSSSLTSRVPACLLT